MAIWKWNYKLSIHSSDKCESSELRNLILNKLRTWGSFCNLITAFVWIPSIKKNFPQRLSLKKKLSVKNGFNLLIFQSNKCPTSVKVTVAASSMCNRHGPGNFWFFSKLNFSNGFVFLTTEMTHWQICHDISKDTRNYHTWENAEQTK